MNTSRADRVTGLSPHYPEQGRPVHAGRTNRFTGLVLFSLLGLLLVVCLLVLTAGSRVWNDLEARTDHNYTIRTVLSYVANKVRSAESAGVLDDGSGVLTLSADYGGTEYITYIYYQDGALLEYFGRADLDFRPELGETVAACGGFSARREDDTIYVSVTDAGGETFGMHLTTGGGLT